MVVSRAATVCSHSAILMVNKADTVNSSSINSHSSSTNSHSSSTNSSNTSGHNNNMAVWVVDISRTHTNSNVRNRNGLAATAWVNLHKVGMVVMAACRIRISRSNTVSKWAVNPNNSVECTK